MEILKYLNQFLIQSNWLGENVPEQARALFTSWYLMENVDTDTKKCDTTLLMLYDNAALETVDVTYEEFENFMVGLIVLGRKETLA